MARVVSVNVGPVQTRMWQGRTVRSAIWKGPVAGRVAVRGVNLAGDDQADRSVHGGPDKAVYAYAVEDYGYWREAGYAVEPGTFGENLTVEGISLTDAVIGTVWRVGSATLQVAQPRQPCWKIGMRMDDLRFPRAFARAARPGAYLCILEEGEVGAGDVIDEGTVPDHGLTIALLNRFVLGDRSLARRVAVTPDVPDDLRLWAAEQVDRRSQRN